MRYALRLSLPDRPGTLGTLATALGAARIDIVALDVIERDDDITVDDLWVDTDLAAPRVHEICEAVGGVVVEALTPVRAAHSRTSDVALAADVAEGPGDPVEELVAGLPATLGVTWAVALAETATGVDVLAASPLTPAIPAGLRLPSLPLRRPRRFPQAQWMPPQWRAQPEDRTEVAGARLGVPAELVIVARVNGPRFRHAELQRLAQLGRVAVAARRTVPLTSGA